MQHKEQTPFVKIGISLIIMWLTLVGYYLLKGLSGILTMHHYQFAPWEPIQFYTLSVWMPWLALTPLVLLLATRFPVLPDSWARGMLKHLCMMLVLTLLHGYVYALAYYEFGHVTPDMVDYEPWQHTGHFLFFYGDIFAIDIFIYTFLVASQNISHFFSLVRQKEQDAARMQRQLVESKLQALKMQINPHFLFNTLNSIAVLVKKQETAKAGEMIEGLSEFFRQTLAQGDQQMVPLRQELALIEQYLGIEQIRFGERLEIEYNIDPASLEIAVPVLLLQPLVENAIKHGLAKKAGPCRLLISAQHTGSGLVLEVIDDGVGTASVTPVTGVGLRNVQDRLLALYEDRHEFSFTSTPDAGTAISIVLGVA